MHTRVEHEINELLREPVLRALFPHGFTADDVLARLHAIGRLTISVEDLHSEGGLLAEAYWRCNVALRDDPAGVAAGRGLSLTAAAMRCLLDSEAQLAELLDVDERAWRHLLDNGPLGDARDPRAE